MPFVDLVQALGVESFLGELGRMEVAHARVAPGQYGLSLIAGGMELTPLELAGMYATLAEDGSFRPLRLTLDDAPASPTPIFNPGAAWLTRHTLEKKDRPDFPRRRDTATPPEIHWKTGTSFGFRDAWSAGSGPAYTAVVWTGNVDMTGSSDLVGSEAAAPILFDVLEGLRDRSRVPVATVPPTDLTPIEVCRYSGHVPSESCTDRVTVLAPIHAVPTKPCPFHHAYEVDRETGRAVLPSCRVAGRDYVRKSFVVLPSAITAWFTARNRALPEQPVFADHCVGDPNLAPPTILMPSLGQVVTLLPGVSTNRQDVPLSASSRSARLSWFVDGTHLGTVRSDERLFWTPTVGSHELVVSDEAGRKARRTLEVKLAGPSAALEE
ncbi:MAG: penicillin-binding transpeptidase domain-containing protein [Kofleriaceae bacterium]